MKQYFLKKTYGYLRSRQFLNPKVSQQCECFQDCLSSEVNKTQLLLSQQDTLTTKKALVCESISFFFISQFFTPSRSPAYEIPKHICPNTSDVNPNVIWYKLIYSQFICSHFSCLCTGNADVMLMSFV